MNPTLLRLHLANRDRFTAKVWRDDMGQLQTGGCADLPDLLWEINSARNHDGLTPLELEDVETMVYWPDSSAAARLTFQLPT